MKSKLRIIGLAVIIAVLGIGCSSLPPIEDSNSIQHYIAISRDGGLEVVKPGQPIDSRSTANTTEAEAVYDRIIAGIKQHPKNSDGKIEVLIYVHGGLNSEAGALRRVQTKYRDILNGGKYPVFVNWQSGPITTYGAHLTRIRQGEVSKYGWLTSPIYLATDIAKSFINAPKSWLITGRQAIDSTTNLLSDQVRLERYNAPDSRRIYYDEADENFTTWRRSAQWWATSPFKLMTTPFTYTLARPAWDVMLRRTNTPFYTPSDHIAFNGQQFRSGSHGSGALFGFLRKLHSEVDQIPMSITLVGHSMGAIIVNKIITLDMSLPIDNIVHMASADSINNLFNHIVPYLSKNQDANFYSLALHPDNENRESNALGFTPSGSLLVWIDNMFTTPETVMDKRSGSWLNMERAFALLPEPVLDQMHFKIFGQTVENSTGGYIDTPQKHGEFGDLKFWSKSVWWK